MDSSVSSSPRTLLLSFCDQLSPLSQRENSNGGSNNFGGNDTKNQRQSEECELNMYNDLDSLLKLLQTTNKIVENGLQDFVIQLRDNGGRPLPEAITLTKEASEIYNSIVETAISMHHLFWVALVRWTLSISKKGPDKEINRNETLRSLPYLVSSSCNFFNKTQKNEDRQNSIFKDLEESVAECLRTRFLYEESVDESQVKSCRQTIFDFIMTNSAGNADSQSQIQNENYIDSTRNDAILSEVLAAIKNVLRLWHLSSSFFMMHFQKCQSEGKEGSNLNLDETPLKILESPSMLRMYNFLYATQNRWFNQNSAGLTDSWPVDIPQQACLVINYLIRGSPQTMLVQLLRSDHVNDTKKGSEKATPPMMLQSLARGLVGPTSLSLHQEQEQKHQNQSVRNLLAHVRLLHVLVACSPSSSSSMSSQFSGTGSYETILSSNDILYQIGLCLTQEDDGGEESTASKSTTVPSVLITTLAWALRSTDWDQVLDDRTTNASTDVTNNKSDGTANAEKCGKGRTEHEVTNANESDSNDDNVAGPIVSSPKDLQTKAELMEEICNVLFAINMGAKLAANSTKSEEELMTQLGILIGEILQLPNAAIPLYRVKLACLNLVMDSPKNYSYYLYINNIVQPHLLTVLWIQVTQVTLLNDKDGGGGPSQNDAPIVLPILIVLTKLCQANALVLKQVENEIFPQGQGARGIFDCPIFPDLTSILDIPSPYRKRWRSIAKKTSSDHTTNIDESKEVDNEEGSSSSSTKKKNDKMAPEDAPQGTLRYKLIHLMTHTDSNIKRCSAELMWILCHSNSNEFVRRTGFGNAVHLLSIKGLFQIPTAPSR